MDIYLLDNNTYRRKMLIDDYVSVIWTERVSSIGDFELHLAPSDSRWNALTIGSILGNSESRRGMIIEERLEKTNESGEETLVLKGRSLEVILTWRVVVPNAGKQNVFYEASASTTCGFLIRRYCMENNELGGDLDIFPSLHIYNSASVGDLVPFSFAPQSVYDAVKSVCDAENMIFGVNIMPEAPYLQLYIRNGIERDIHFSVDEETLTEIEYLQNNADYYNIAYVWGKDGKIAVSVYDSFTKKGFNRRVIPVVASDVGEDTDVTFVQARGQLYWRGRAELAKHRYQKIIDGKASGVDPYTYQYHYDIGDVVTVKYSATQSTKVKISEFIFASDANGERKYPSFSTIS